MRVLMISYDRNMFTEGSDAHANVLSYGEFMDELHVIVFSRKAHNLEKKKIGDNIWLYPTSGSPAWMSIFKAISIGKKIKNIDIITTQDPFEAGLVGYILKLAHRVPLQLQLHGDYFSSDYWRRESVLNGGRRVVGEILLRQADCIRVVSGRIEQSLVELGISEKRIVRNPIAISPEYFSEKDPKQDLHKENPAADFIFLSMARLVPVKNLGLLINAFHTVLKAHPKATLVLVGSGPEEKKLKHIAAEYKIEKGVVFMPWTEDPYSLYKTADAYVLSSNYEGWGKVVIEAMATGLSVIMTDVGCAREVVEDKESGLIVPVGNKEKLAEAMKTMIEQNALRQKLEQNARERARGLPSQAAYLTTYKESLSACQNKNNEENR